MNNRIGVVLCVAILPCVGAYSVSVPEELDVFAQRMAGFRSDGSPLQVEGTYLREHLAQIVSINGESVQPTYNYVADVVEMRDGESYRARTRSYMNVDPNNPATSSPVCSVMVDCDKDICYCCRLPGEARTHDFVIAPRSFPLFELVSMDQDNSIVDVLTWHSGHVSVKEIQQETSSTEWLERDQGDVVLFEKRDLVEPGPHEQRIVFRYSKGRRNVEWVGVYLDEGISSSTLRWEREYFYPDDIRAFWPNEIRSSTYLPNGRIWTTDVLHITTFRTREVHLPTLAGFAVPVKATSYVVDHRSGGKVVTNGERAGLVSSAY